MADSFIRKITDADGNLLRFEKVTEIVEIIYPEQLDQQLQLSQEHTDAIQATKDSLSTPHETVVQDPNQPNP